MGVGGGGGVCKYTVLAALQCLIFDTSHPASRRRLSLTRPRAIRSQVIWEFDQKKWMKPMIHPGLPVPHAVIARVWFALLSLHPQFNLYCLNLTKKNVCFFSERKVKIEVSQTLVFITRLYLFFGGFF